MSHLLEQLARWRPFTALVVGDFMLDQLVFGSADRLSPEAPVPVLHVHETQDRPGGAANVCLDLVAMKATVFGLGVVGDDRAADLLRSVLTAERVNADGLITDPSRPTTTKQSLIGLAQQRHQQKMFRVDFEKREPISTPLAEAILRRFEGALPSADVVVIEDYNKGVCTPALCQGVIARARAARVPVLVDPALIPDYSKYRGATTITPNRTEAVLAACDASAAGALVAPPPDAQATAYTAIGRKLVADLDLECAVITLDKHGALLVERDAGRARSVPTVARQVYDVTGAGDMVLAALAAARANGIDWFDAVRLANAAAGLEVEVFGVVPMPIERIHREVMLREGGVSATQGKLRTLHQLLVEAAALRNDARRIVLTNGCFDVLHAGHLSLLRRARELGDFLVVAINSDDSVRRLKGAKDPTRPINNQIDRAELLGGLECVGAVVVFDEDTPEQLIRAVRPDVLVKGDEYVLAQVPGASFVLESGGRVELLPMIEGKSTTRTVSRIRGS